MVFVESKKERYNTLIHPGIGVTLLFLFLFFHPVKAQEENPFYKKAQMLIGDFSSFHVHPIENKESVAKEIMELFIKNIDPYGMVLKETDIEQLKLQAPLLLQQIASGKNDGLTRAHNLYKKALLSNDSILESISKKPLNFKEKDSVTFLSPGEKTEYSDNMQVQARRILKQVKIQCLRKALIAADSAALNEEQFNKKAESFAKNVIIRLRTDLKTKIEHSEADAQQAMLNAIAMRHDPHSDFFTYEQNKSFQQDLSAHVESFGLTFSETEKGETAVGYVSPGGPAWMSNEINEGDRLVAITLGTKKITVEENEAEDIQQLLENTDEKTVEVELKKKNGLSKKIQLIKRKMESDENFVKGYVLKGHKLNLGYIALPSFYTEMDDPGQPGCANDVAKEILKLENDSIAGLIIDLRNNGGGSMLEAMNLAGIFVDEGPLFIYKAKNKKPQLMKDMNRGTVFKKPIIVLINEFSASASELFSNVVKDYNLGLIVGQTSYGKGTAQIVLPLDTNVLYNKGKNNTKKMDYIKVTNALFYRLNCSTHQGIGVIPDITFPSAMKLYAHFRENNSPHFIRPDSIQKKVIYTPKQPFPIEALKQKSLSRQSTSLDFKNFKQKSDSLMNFFNTPGRIALNQKGFSQYIKQIERISHTAEDAEKVKKSSIQAKNNSFDKKLYEINSNLKEFNEGILESISSDLFINEAFMILKDMVNQ